MTDFFAMRGIRHWTVNCEKNLKINNLKLIGKQIKIKKEWFRR